MEIIKLDSFGVTISHPIGDKGGATITSNMKEADTIDNALFNAAVDGLESMTLAHFCAGIDVTSPRYLEGLETAYQALGNNIGTVDEVDFDLATARQGKVLIKKHRNGDAEVEETIFYEIDKIDWETALAADGNDFNDAFKVLQRELKVERVHYESKMGDLWNIEGYTVDVI